MNLINDILQTIEEITEEKPNLPIFQETQKTYTYRDLKEKSDCIASYILDHLGQECRPIVVYGKQNFAMMATMVGCSKAGRPYIPIDEHTPSERLQTILDVAKPELVLYNEEFRDDVTGVAVKSVHSLRGVEKDAYPGLDLDDVYYIIFTSGTTGIPKGVEITHRNLLSFINWTLSDFNLDLHERFLLQAPFSFDLSVMSLYPALVSKGTLVPLTKDVINDFQKLFQVLPKLDLSVWVSTPSFMDICLMQPTFDAKHLPSIKHFLFCGEELTHKTAQELRNRFPEADLFNTYGPTEATVAVSAINITQQVLDQNKRLPIGYVKDDTKVIIFDDGKEVSAGQEGEIIIAGPSVSCGYLNNPEKTEQAFFEYEGMPAYRTGDLGYFGEHQLLYYAGRKDFQVKLHGYRMELEDIDHHLNDVKYVKQATVVPKYKNHKVEKLIAYVVPSGDDFAKDYERTKAIKKAMAETVMDYMIPQKFIYVEKLPLTSNGKIDRKGLINEVNAT